MQFTHESNYEYRSRRSVVLSPSAAVASSQPLATEAGLEVLRAGGTAADAAIAVAAALQVTQACSTGLGGDAFCLYYEAATGRVHAYNGSGRAPGALTLELAREAAVDGATPAAERATPAAGDATPAPGEPRTPAGDRASGGVRPAAGPASAASGVLPDFPGVLPDFPGVLPDFHAHTVTVPGAADAWVEVQRRFGRLTLDSVLAPAIRLARDGFSLEPMTANWWAAGAERQLAKHRHGGELMIDGRAPRVGERFRNPALASVLAAIAADGRDGFYSGRVAEAVVAEVEHEGGVMSLHDLAVHRGEWVDPISVAYGDYRVWECPPNGQGLAALLALGTYAHLRADAAGRSARLSPARLLHAQVESMRLAFADAARFVADPAFSPAPLDELLGDAYAARRASEIDLDGRIPDAGAGLPPSTVGDDTVYFSVVDADGNGCSFINSNFMGFGTGIVPEGCGFSLQNRGRGFSLEEGHANVLAPGKRPFHTIIPGLLTHRDGGPGDGSLRDGSLAAVFGVMGGMMQPQGHLQVVAGLVDDLLDPQSVLDAPRFQLSDGDPNGELLVEDSFDDEILAELRDLGHDVVPVEGLRRGLFGLGQVIAIGDDGILWAGSDPRGDGYAGGF